MGGGGGGGGRIGIKEFKICDFTTDIDECELGIDGCDGGCINTGGSFVCNCSVPEFGEGYEVGDDTTSCVGKLIL